MSDNAIEITPGSIWIHKKTRSEYSVVVEAYAENDSSRQVVYKSLNNGSVWVRPRPAFVTKFQPLQKTPPAHE
jgi:hypothetical protein